MKLIEAFDNRKKISFDIIKGNLVNIPAKLDKLLKYLSYRGEYDRIKKEISSANYAAKNWNEPVLKNDKFQFLILDIAKLLEKIKNHDDNFQVRIVSDSIIEINISEIKLKSILK